MNNKFYAGIGSRKTPVDICKIFTNTAKSLENHGFILRSGGAEGADKAFEKGVVNMRNKRIYLPWSGFNGNKSNLHNLDIGDYVTAARFHPRWDKLSPAVKLLIARNSRQILGDTSEKTRSSFIICWTENGLTQGGTGQPLRIAKNFKIPVFNLGKQTVRKNWPKPLEKLGIYL